MPKESYYELLGIKEDASLEEIKEGFKRQANIWHPDKHADAGYGSAKYREAEERFKEISVACYDLSDSKRRAEYDELLRQIRNPEIEEIYFDPLEPELAPVAGKESHSYTQKPNPSASTSTPPGGSGSSNNPPSPRPKQNAGVILALLAVFFVVWIIEEYKTTAVSTAAAAASYAQPRPVPTPWSDIAYVGRTYSEEVEHDRIRRLGIFTLGSHSDLGWITFWTVRSYKLKLPVDRIRERLIDYFRDNGQLVNPKDPDQSVLRIKTKVGFLKTIETIISISTSGPGTRIVVTVKLPEGLRVNRESAVAEAVGIYAAVDSLFKAHTIP
jgi:curved DNA-binding protein CbpA